MQHLPVSLSLRPLSAFCPTRVGKLDFLVSSDDAMWRCRNLVMLLVRSKHLLDCDEEIILNGLKSGFDAALEQLRNFVGAFVDEFAD
jgi:hypothetical protein